MKILVTGGTGFTGKALVKRLLDDGHQVVALDYKEGLKTQELREWGAEVVIGSVTDAAVVEQCMQGVDIVQHLAAAFRELEVPESYYDEVNLGGTEVVLAAALKEGVKKVVYCSTCGCMATLIIPRPVRMPRFSQQIIIKKPNIKQNRWWLIISKPKA